MGEQRRFRQPQVGPPPPGSSTNGLDDSQDESEEDIDRIDLTRTFSAREVLRKKSFAEYTPDEFTQARVMIEELQWDLGRRRTRRWGRGDGRQLDLRRALRSSLRYGGERAPANEASKDDAAQAGADLRRKRLDGAYTRMLLQFIHTLYGGLDNRVEAFLFATRLTRVTGHLDYRDIDRSIDEVSKAVPDWSGGTRIGDILKTFNFRWARRVLGWGSVVLVISDGWDRGEPALFGREMERLQRSSHRLIWLNPLAGSANYEPLTRGMRAAIPYIDDLMPVHNLASLEDLARHLNTLSDRRPERRQHIAAPEPADDAPAVSRVRGSSRHRTANPTFRHPLWGREG